MSEGNSDGKIPSGAELVIEGGTVVTMDRERRVLADGHVLIRDGEIAAVGEGAAAAGEGARRIDASGCVVTPGLINTHQHPWYNLFKGLGNGMLLEQWIRNLLKPAAETIAPPELEISSRLACLEMLATGTTTCVNHSVTVTGEEEVEATLAPVADSGMRQLFCKEVRTRGLDEQLALAEEIHSRWHGAADGRISIGLVLESTAHWVAMGTSSEELLVRGNELAARLGTHISDHIAGGTMSREAGYLRFMLEMGRTDLQFLHDLGVLDSKWILAHVINAQDRDIELIASSGASVSHCPTSESARGGGITRVKVMRDAGINVTLGSDGPMVDTSVDMVEQMKAVQLFQAQLHREPLAVPADDALAMATCDAAASIGLGDEIGSLEPGKRADIAVFDLATPACGVWHDPLTALISSRGTLRTVLVDGEELVSEGSFTRVSDAELAELLEEARARAADVLERGEIPAAHRDARERAQLEALV